MVRKIVVIILLFTGWCTLSGQEIGLVLSGGGAKGLAHIGVIKALEENEIPIDYITGTSMGAIIGALYASGYSVEEMTDLALSEDFLRWASGEINRKYYYYFKQDDPEASMFTLDISLKDSVPKPALPSNLISTEPMDFAFMEILAGASAAAGNVFDSLMVPYRCIASDIHSNRPVVLKKGDLAKAVRASMTYPFYFKPIRIEGTLLFDGGMHNNFPVDIMVEEFKPDFVIGSKTASNSPEPTEEDLLLQLENMLLAKTEYAIDDSMGVLIETSLEEIKILDFQYADEIMKKGYDAAYLHIGNIKRKISRRISAAELKARRDGFRSRIPEMNFIELNIEGVNEEQAEYVANSIWKEGKVLNMEELRENYFRLVADELVSKVYPTATYDQEKTGYILNLDVRVADRMKVKVGGNIASSSINQGYAGFEYNSLSNTSMKIGANAYFGRLYSSAQMKVRFDYPTRVPFYTQISTTLNRWDFYNSSPDPFFEDVRPSYIIKDEGNFRIDFAMPYGNNNAFKLSLAAGRMNDSYYQVLKFSQTDTTDKSRYDYYTVNTGFGRSNLNHIQYPTSGEKVWAGIRYTGGITTFIPGSRSRLEEKSETDYKYFSFEAQWKKYLRINRKWNVGLYGEVYVSSMQLQDNYYATIINARSFQPVPHSSTLFLENYRAHDYGAVGIMPVLKIGRSWHLTNESYLFVPYRKIRKIQEDEVYVPEYENPFKRYYLMNTTALVYHSRIGPVVLSLNYYNKKDKNFYIVFNFGYIIFNKRGID
ncbi:MAG: patatin-like phospholipase family protein [Bacteroidales bacterium]